MEHFTKRCELDRSFVQRLVNSWTIGEDVMQKSFKWK